MREVILKWSLNKDHVNYGYVFKIINKNYCQWGFWALKDKNDCE